MVAGTLGNLPFKINVCAEGEFDGHQEMSDMMPVKLDNIQGLLKNVCTWKVASPVGTGIGSSRSLIFGIVASGPEFFLISEAWEIRKAAIYSPRLIISGHKRLHSLAEYLCTLLPPLLLSSRGHFAHEACLFWVPCGWWTLTSWSSKSSVPACCILPVSVGFASLGWTPQLQKDVGWDVNQM